MDLAPRNEANPLPITGSRHARPGRTNWKALRLAIGSSRSSSGAHSESRRGFLPWGELKRRCTQSVNPPRKQRMSFRQRSVTYVKSFLRAFTREKRYPTCFKFRFVSSPLQRYQKRHGSFAKPFCANALDLRGPLNLGRSSHGEHWGLDSSLPQRRAGRSGAPALVKVMLDRLAICIGLRGGPASEWLYPEVLTKHAARLETLPTVHPLPRSLRFRRTT